MACLKKRKFQGRDGLPGYKGAKGAPGQTGRSGTKVTSSRKSCKMSNDSDLTEEKNCPGVIKSC